MEPEEHWLVHKTSSWCPAGFCKAQKKISNICGRGLQVARHGVVKQASTNRWHLLCYLETREELTRITIQNVAGSAFQAQ